MSRPIDPKCWHCSQLAIATARELHGEAGDGCWSEQTCHRKRSHYRNRADNNQKRKGEYAADKAQRQISAQPAVQPAAQPAVQPAVQSPIDPPTAPPIALLYLYREARKDAHLHALAVAVWQGNLKLEEIPATHCMGMTNSQVRQYLQAVLADLHQRYRIQTFEPEIRYDPCFCPIRPCPLHAAGETQKPFPDSARV